VGTEKLTTFKVTFPYKPGDGNESIAEQTAILQLDIRNGHIFLSEKTINRSRAWTLSREVAKEIGEAFLGAARAEHSGVPTQERFVDPFELIKDIFVSPQVDKSFDSFNESMKKLPEQPCLLDGFEHDRPIGLVCPCKKCSIYCG